MSEATLTISARNAGQVELKKFCPRCAWYLLRLKKMPFQFGMPGVMFYMEQCEKSFILAHLAKHGCLPKSFGPFATCIEPVEFPFRMTALHEETGVNVTAQVDLMLRRKDGSIALLDLKTAKANGGGEVFHPQYEIQVTGYSWVTQEANIGKVGSAGLIFCEIQNDAFKANPLKYAAGEGIVVPFNFAAREVELDYKRFAKCLREMSRIWDAARPPKGADGCKDCMLLNRLFDFEDNLRSTDALNARVFPRYRDEIISIHYLRDLARGTPQRLTIILEDEELHFDDGGPWALWDFS
jgi:hypothetical protein